MNYEAVLAGLPDAVIAVDTSLRIVFWNSAAEVLTERSARRANGRLVKEVFPAEASVVRRLGETLATGESRSEPEALVERPDGRQVPVSIVTAPLFGHDGTVEAAVAVLRDLSRIRQLEAEVRRGETLAAAGRMAVGLAHEIRNPLGAIRGAVQLLKRELGAGSRLTEYTDVLVTEVDRVNRIIEMLLDLARPVQLRLVPLNLHQLLERVALLAEEGARERTIAIVRRYDPSLPPILGDEDRLISPEPVEEVALVDRSEIKLEQVDAQSLRDSPVERDRTAGEVGLPLEQPGHTGVNIDRVGEEIDRAKREAARAVGAIGKNLLLIGVGCDRGSQRGQRILCAVEQIDG